MTHRFFIDGDLAAHQPVILSGATAHHVIRALRLRVGENVVLFNGRGGEYPGRVGEMTKDAVTVEIDRFEPREAELPFRITVAQGIAGGDKMDWTIEKAVELGAFAVQPLSMERSVVRLSAERAVKREAHWRALVQAACAQCGRNRVPEVSPVATLAQWLPRIAPDALCLVLSPDARSSIHHVPRPTSDTPIVLLVGPEGGFSQDELRAAVASGFLEVSLGPRVLRTETAAAAALAMLTGAWSEKNEGG